VKNRREEKKSAVLDNYLVGHRAASAVQKENKVGALEGWWFLGLQDSLRR
jgi:hypothetical protein